jgi:hypothetical protein
VKNNYKLSAFSRQLKNIQPKGQKNIIEEMLDAGYRKKIFSFAESL